MRNVPLDFVNVGEQLKIINIIGSKAICKRLREMGFINGIIIKILRNDVGPVIVKIGDSRIVLGRVMAKKVIGDIIVC